MTKTIMITGATDGIGLETAKRLAPLGHHLLIHGRSTKKLADVQKSLSGIIVRVRSRPMKLTLHGYLMRNYSPMPF